MAFGPRGARAPAVVPGPRLRAGVVGPPNGVGRYVAGPSLRGLSLPLRTRGYGGRRPSFGSMPAWTLPSHPRLVVVRLGWHWGRRPSMPPGDTLARDQLSPQALRAWCSYLKTSRAPPSPKCPSCVTPFASRTPRYGTTLPQLVAWWGSRRPGPQLPKPASRVLCAGGLVFPLVALGPPTLGPVVWLWLRGAKARAALRCLPACPRSLGGTGMVCITVSLRFASRQLLALLARTWWSSRCMATPEGGMALSVLVPCSDPWSTPSWAPGSPG
mgnify:CR=1 FL=1